MLEQFERDLQIVEKAIEQSLANHNVLLGQKQTILHYIEKTKAAAATVEKAASTVEEVANTVEATVEAVAH